MGRGPLGGEPGFRVDAFRVAVEDIEGVDDHVGLGDGRDGAGGAGLRVFAPGFGVVGRRGEAERDGGRLGAHAVEMCRMPRLRIASISKESGIRIWSSSGSAMNSLIVGVVGYHGLKVARCS